MLPLTAEALLMIHALGAALGAAGVTFAELFYTQAVVDGKIDSCEKKHIEHTLWALQWGVSIMVLAGIGLIIVEYFLPYSEQTVLTAPFWMIHTLTVVVIVFGFLISRNLVPWWLGSAAAFSAWWTMLALHAWRTIPLGYLALWLAYVLVTAAAICIFPYIRSFLIDREKRSRT